MMFKLNNFFLIIIALTSIVSPEKTKIKQAFLNNNPIQNQLKSFAEGEEGKGEESQAEAVFRNISFSVKCMLVDNFTVYDLTGMAKNRLEDDGYKDFNVTLNGNTINYEFCYDLVKENRCNNDQLAQVSSIDKTKCNQLAGSISTGNKWKLSENLIEIELNRIDNSTDLVKYQIECDKNDTKKYPTFIEKKSYYRKEINGNQETLLYFKSKHGCPKIDFYTFWKFINDYDYIFAVLLIILGLFECILGFKLSMPTAFIITCSGVLILVVILFFQFILPPGTKSWIIWVILFIGLVIGIFAGYFVAQNKDKCLALVVGGVAGFFLGEFFFNLFGNKIGTNLTLVHIGFIVGGIAVLVLLSFIFSSFIIIFSTSLIGAYAVIRGISFFAGKFPSEITIIDLTRAGETDQLKEMLSWEIYLYLCAIIVLTVGSIFIQFKLRDDNDQKYSINEMDTGLTN